MAPVTLYYGDSDQEVPPANSEVAFDYMTGKGKKNIRTVGVGALAHIPAMLPSFKGAAEWFGCAVSHSADADPACFARWVKAVKTGRS